MKFFFVKEILRFVVHYTPRHGSWSSSKSSGDRLWTFFAHSRTSRSVPVFITIYILQYITFVATLLCSLNECIYWLLVITWLASQTRVKVITTDHCSVEISVWNLRPSCPCTFCNVPEWEDTTENFVVTKIRCDYCKVLYSTLVLRIKCTFWIYIFVCNDC